MTDSSLTKDLRSGALGARLAEIAVEASRVILPYWRNDAVVTRKPDESPVTEADHAAEALILERLRALYPKTAVVAEEAMAGGVVIGELGRRFFLVDPLDGTRGFVAGRESFAVNIGLVENGRPVAGAVAAPAMGVVWHTGPEGAVRRRFDDAQGQAVRVRERPAAGGVALLSHSLSDEVAERLAMRHGCASWQGMDSAIKFCLIAEGRYDVYPRQGRTMEWDTAAGEAVLMAAGGRLVAEDGGPMTYGKAPGFENPGFTALGG